MFDKLAGKLNQVTGEKTCPRCGEDVTPVPISSGNLLRCPKCQYKAGSTEWLSQGNADSVPTWNDPADPPYQNRIHKKATDSDTTWAIPATKKPSFLLVFGLIWLTFSSFFTYMMFFGSGEGDNIQDEWGTLGAVAFISVFLLVGIGMTYFGLAQVLTRHLLYFHAGTLVYGKSFLGREKKLTFRADEISNIHLKEFYQQNYQPIYGLEIKGKGGKARFGSVLTVDEKSWLVADLRATIFPEKEAPQNLQTLSGATSPNTPTSSLSDGSRLDYLTSTPSSGQPRGDFKVTIPATKKTASNVLGGVFLMIFGALFGGLPGREMLNGLDALDFFLLIFVVVGFGILCAGVGVIIYSLMQIGVETVVEKSGSSLRIFKKKGGRKSLKKDLGNAQVQDIRLVPSFANNNRQASGAQYNLTLITENEAVKVVTGRPEEEIQEAFNQLQSHLL